MSSISIVGFPTLLVRWFMGPWSLNFCREILTRNVQKVWRQTESAPLRNFGGTMYLTNQYEGLKYSKMLIKSDVVFVVGLHFNKRRKSEFVEDLQNLECHRRSYASSLLKFFMQLKARWANNSAAGKLRIRLQFCGGIASKQMKWRGFVSPFFLIIRLPEDIQKPHLQIGRETHRTRNHKQRKLAAEKKLL